MRIDTGKPRGRIALAMIVKNEAHVIRRCLASVRPLVDRWVVVDTGSGDGTQDIVRDAMADLPGELIERPWVDFAHNRNQALDAARTWADYCFTIDADECLDWPAGYALPALDADAYALWMEYAGLRYRRTCLLRSATPWRWHGVLHEYLDAGRETTVLPLDGPRVIVRAEGARSRNPDKFREDAAVLERALREDPGNARYQFYLAQSWRDAGEHARALEAYAQRASMGGWDEECWYSHWQMARLREQLAQPAAEIVQAYLAAYAERPRRAEPLVDLARFHRLRGEWALAWLHAHAAVAIPMPDDLLFVDAATYQWRALDEYAIASYYAGRLEGGAAALRRLLTEGHVPVGEMERVRGNAGYYRSAGWLSDLTH
jgi:hypothetical protein